MKKSNEIFYHLLPSFIVGGSIILGSIIISNTLKMVVNWLLQVI